MTLLQIRKIVRECKEEVLTSLKLQGNCIELQTIYLCLDEIEDNLNSSAISEKISALQAAQEKLVSVANTISQDVEELRIISKNIKNVAKALKILTDIGKQAASLGA